MRRLLAFLALLTFLSCGANQLRVASAQMFDLAARTEVARLAIGGACSDLDDATDRKVDLCIDAAETYVDLVATMLSLATAIRVAEGKEDPNVANVVELLRRATVLEHRLSILVEALEGA